MDGRDYIVIDKVRVVNRKEARLGNKKPIALEGRFPFISLSTGLLMFGTVTYRRSGEKA